MKKKHLAILTAAAMAFAAQTATAQFFTNDLTDAASAALDFNEYSGSQGNSVWSFTNDYALAQDGTTNTVLQGGAVLDWVTADDDTARSYLGTTFSNWLGKSWKAHIAIEAPASTKPYIFFGLGDPTPKESYYNEPRNGESVYLRFQSGSSNSKVSIIQNTGATLHNTGSWRGDPGYDLWMTYNHINKTIQFDLDDWNGGRYSDIDLSTPEISVDGILTATNVMHIFFGANAKVTFRDFDVYEIDAETPPAVPQNIYTVISNMAVAVNWDEAGGADSYIVKRSEESGTNYVTLASGLTNLSFVDTTVESNKTYYYVVNATNQFGVSDDSSEVTGVGFPYDIIGTDATYKNNPALAKDNLFDNDLTTFFDGSGSGWAGLDLGSAQQILQIDYVLRNWNPHAFNGATNSTFEGANQADFSDAVTLYTITTNTANNPTVNVAMITNSTSFRYVRLLPRDSNACNFMAELNIVTTENIQATTNGTLHAWLDSYYDVATLFGGDYELADVSDTDGDGFQAWEEAIAGTIPTNSNSLLVVTSGEQIGSGDFVVTWQSVEGKDYSIITNANLAFPNPGTAVSGIAGKDGETSYTGTVNSASTLFYEVGVQ